MRVFVLRAGMCGPKFGYDEHQLTFGKKSLALAGWPVSARGWLGERKTIGQTEYRMAGGTRYS